MWGGPAATTCGDLFTSLTKLAASSAVCKQVKRDSLSPNGSENSGLSDTGISCGVQQRRSSAAAAADAPAGHSIRHRAQAGPFADLAMDHQQPRQRYQRETGAGQERSLRPRDVPEAACNDAGCE